MTYQHVEPMLGEGPGFNSQLGRSFVLATQPQYNGETRPNIYIYFER